MWCYHTIKCFFSTTATVSACSVGAPSGALFFALITYVMAGILRSQRERFMERVFFVGEGLLFVLIHQIGKYEINTTSSSVALYRYANTLCFDLRKVKRCACGNLAYQQKCVATLLQAT
jgi:hypothetical protein